MRIHLFIDRFHSRGQQLCKFIGTKESFYTRKEFNSHRIGLVHQNGRRFIVLVHQYGRRDVMWKRSIGCFCQVQSATQFQNIYIFFPSPRSWQRYRLTWAPHQLCFQKERRRVGECCSFKYTVPFYDMSDYRIVSGWIPLKRWTVLISALKNIYSC